MKSYTGIDQSKKLAKILPVESADMYRVFENNAETRVYYGKVPTAYFVCEPCWSLPALLSVLRTFTQPTAFSVKVSVPSLTKTENGYKLTYTGDYMPMIESIADNAIDCCVNMIIHLHSLK